MFFFVAGLERARRGGWLSIAALKIRLIRFVTTYKDNAKLGSRERRMALDAKPVRMPASTRPD
jgi:hypothetical protein